MTSPTYELIKRLESLDYFPQILTSGIIPMNWIDYKVIYEFYISEIAKLNKGGKVTGQELRTAKRTAKTYTADEFKIAESSVYRLIQKMES